ncbi:hypothetical protein C2G38_2178295 [Gigaspora rosea]|uniref:Uncharacterized protein n=1 Tax=Gigaspora rosea TaxID=44941 RepID=A0A397VLN4_9GLOM|nr:hypothetical protein C2G38_2178295 [Gigaspora rosea]
MTDTGFFGITFGVVAKDTVRDSLESPLESPLVPSDFEARETFLTFLEVVGRALLESPFVRNGVIGIGACAVGVTACSRRCY